MVVAKVAVKEAWDMFLLDVVQKKAIDLNRSKKVDDCIEAISFLRVSFMRRVEN
jgi:hypothetical protein